MGLSNYRKFAIITISAVIFLIFVGGFVRATGAGMGCPDWPKCFGMWVPPTSVEQLPENYQEIFGAKLKGEVIFNPVKTWIEYVNRLVGASVGLFILIATILSFKQFFKTNRKIFVITFISFVLVLYQAWLGAKVVASELAPHMITLHMFLAIVILGLLIWAVLHSYEGETFYSSNINVADLQFLLVLVLMFTVGQIVFGTQIREGIDVAQKLLGEEGRALWIYEVQGKVIFHAVLGVIILVLHGLIFRKIKGRFENKILSDFAFWGLALVICEIISGTILSLAGFPAMMQPLHLTFSSVIVSIQFVLLFILSPRFSK